MGWVLWEDVHPSELQNSLYLTMLTGLMAMQDLQMSGSNKSLWCVWTLVCFCKSDKLVCAQLK